MTTFFDLFADQSTPERGYDPREKDRRFPEVIAGSPFRLWRPGDPIPMRGNRLLIGVATWCGYDMRLLDVMAEALSHKQIDSPIVEVFNLDDLPQKELDRYIKGLGSIFLHHPPVAGFWRDSRLDWFGQGHEAYGFVARLFDFSSDEIGAFVQEWIKTRATAP